MNFLKNHIMFEKWLEAAFCGTSTPQKQLNATNIFESLCWLQLKTGLQV